MMSNTKVNIIMGSIILAYCIAVILSVGTL